MRSSVAFALISFNVVSWATIAAAEEPKPTVTRQVDTTHGVSTMPERTGGVVIANLGAANAGATAGAIHPPVLTAAASSVGAGAMAAGGGHGVTVATFKAGSYTGSTVTGLSAAAARIGLTAGGTGTVATSRTGNDRAGALASFASVQTSTVQPMGTGSAGGNFTAAVVRPGTVIRQSGAAVGGTFSAVAGWRAGVAALESTHVRATVVAEVPVGGIVVLRKPGGATTRAVGIWNSATSMVSPVQRIKPVRKSR